MKELEIIRGSFEEWYNTRMNTGNKISVVTNYSDRQCLTIKAYHTATITLSVVGIRNGMSYINTLFNIEKNYNHGITSEEEIKMIMLKALLSDIYDYCMN